jgi:hypothetical protein
MDHAGIDFGSKRSGKTAICLRREEEWIIRQSIKDHDADAFLQAVVQEYDIPSLFIDAPLSLPAIYKSGKGSDYFYRAADRAASAMSPMFLGGLTARAIQNRDLWVSQLRTVFEAYPGGLVKELDLKPWYKKDLIEFINSLQPHLPFPLPVPENWHQMDALLAWITGYRKALDLHKTLGEAPEGLIYI